MNKPFYRGAHGNLSLHTVTLSLAALAASGTAVLQENVPLGTEVVGVRIISEALGASTSVKVDLVDANGASTALLTSTATTSTTVGAKPLKPVYIGDSGPSDLVLTNTGTGSATGEITIQIEYIYKGY